MSFRFKKTMVTLENYRTIFRECSPDILDEIRSAVLDDTQISKFIGPCGNDNYKLGQLRMAVREFVPVEYLSPKVSGSVIHNIRIGVSKGLDMSDILLYYNKLSNKSLEIISDFLLLGVDITQMDFTLVPDNLVEICLKGLLKGYPMWLIVGEGCKLTTEEVQLYMRGLSLGIDIHPFLTGGWDSSCVLLLFSYGKSVDINDFLRYINNKFSIEHLKELLNLYNKKVDIRNLVLKDEDGYPVYNEYQIHELGIAILDNTITKEMFNPSLSDMDIVEMRNREISKKDRVLNVSLGRKC